MATNKLILYFSTFNDDEIKSLIRETRRTVKASDSLHNQRTLRLFEYLKKYKEDEEKLKDENIFKNVYENLPYNESNKKQFRNFKTDIKTVLENHIITKELTEKKSFERDLILTRYLKSRLMQSDNEESPDNQLFGQYYKLLNEQYKNLLNHTQKSVFDYMDIHTISNYLYYSADTNSWLKPEYGKKDNNNEKLPHPIKTMTDSLDKFYILAKLRYASEMTLRQKMLNEQPKIRLAKEARKAADEWRGSRNILFEAYRKLYDLIHEEEFDINLFREASSYLKYNYEEINHSELCILIRTLINAMTVRRYQGENFQILRYDMYIFGFVQDAFSDEKFLRPQVLINHCYLSVEIGKADTLRDFIDTYINRIRVTPEKPTMERTRTICEAYMYFGLKNYKAALDLLFENPTTVDELFIPYRAIRLKCLYEQSRIGKYVTKDGKEIDLIKESDHFIFALEKRKQTYGSDFYVYYLNFIKFVKQLGTLKGTYRGKTKLAEILESEEYQPIAYKRWLEKKIE